MAPIEIRGNVWDPTAPAVQLSTPGPGKNYILVQLKDEMDDTTLGALISNKVTVIKRIQGNTWLSSIQAPPLPTAAAVPQLAVAVVYDKFFKVNAGLKTQSGTALTDAVIGVLLHDDAADAVNEISQFARGLAGVTVLSASSTMVRIQTNAAANLDKIAGQAAVQAIEVMPDMDLANLCTGVTIGRNDANAALAANPIPRPALGPLAGLTGAGQIVSVADTGLDVTHPSFRGGTVVSGNWYPPPAVIPPNMIDDHGHGTHVASTVLGRPDPVANVEPLSSPGMAPAAQIVVQSIKLKEQPDIASMFAEAYMAPNNARIANNSWGMVLRVQPYVQPEYGDMDANIADKVAKRYPDFTILFAAGNDGTVITNNGNQQIGGWAAAKNVITVGATPSSRLVVPDPGKLGNYRVPYGAGPAGAVPVVLPHSDVSTFSNKGPTAEGWRKPDVVAPGQNILGAHSRQMTAVATQNWDRRYGASVNADYTYSSGTSMATPAVSGCCALIREGLQGVGIANPTSALLKAILINFASPLPPAAFGTPTVPRIRQGFGEVDLRRIPELLRQVQGGAHGGAGAGAGPGAPPSPAAQANATCGVWMGVFNPPAPAMANGVLQTAPPPALQRLARTVTRTWPPAAGPPAATQLRATLVYIDKEGRLLQEKLALAIEYTPTTPIGAQPTGIADMVNGPRSAPGVNNPRFSNVQKVVAPNVGGTVTISVTNSPQVKTTTHFAVVWDFVPAGTPAPLIPPPI